MLRKLNLIKFISSNRWRQLGKNKIAENIIRLYYAKSKNLNHSAIQFTLKYKCDIINI